MENSNETIEIPKSVEIPIGPLLTLGAPNGERPDITFDEAEAGANLLELALRIDRADPKSLVSQLDPVGSKKAGAPCPPQE